MDLEQSIVQWAGIYRQPHYAIKYWMPPFSTVHFSLSQTLSWWGSIAWLLFQGALPWVSAQLSWRSCLCLRVTWQNFAWCSNIVQRAATSHMHLTKLEMGPLGHRHQFLYFTCCNYFRFKYSWVDSTVLACVSSISPWLNESLYDMHALA